MSLPREGQKFLYQKKCDADVKSIAYSPDGNHVVGGVGATVVVWAKATGAVMWKSTPAASESATYVKTVAYAPDGKTIASGDGLNVTLWSAETGAKLWEKECAVNTLSYAPDGSAIASGDGKKIKLRSAETGKELSELDVGSEVTSVAYAPDGQTIVSGNSEKKVTLWSMETSAKLWEQECQGSIHCLAYAPNGKTIVSGGDVMTLWMTKSGTKLWERVCEDEAYPEDEFRAEFLGEKWPVDSVAYSPDNNWIVSAGGGKVTLWSRTYGPRAPLRVMRVSSPGKVTSVAYAPDGLSIASGDTGNPSPSSHHLTLTVVGPMKEVERGADYKAPWLPCCLPDEGELGVNPLEVVGELFGRCLPK